jgi:uncharacterized protein YdhG (YjbR/CyaY superfamily)
MARRADVDAWFARYDNPMKEVVQRMREILLAADARLDECIKWQAPTFTYRGNLASFFPKSKQHASLMFHQGAKIPGTHPRLEGSGAAGRVMKIGSVAEADAARRDLERLAKAWCDWRDAEGSGGNAPKGAAKTPKVEKNAKQRPAAKKKAARKKKARAR